MMVPTRTLLCVLVFFCLVSAGNASKADGKMGKRADTPLEIETLVVADYSAFNKWYELLDTSIPHVKRVDIAKQNLTTWLGAMFHSVNIVYKRLEDHGMFISIKLVDLLIMTTCQKFEDAFRYDGGVCHGIGLNYEKTVADSPWTETTKFQVNSTYMVDTDVIHPLLRVKSGELQKTIPHDHAMLFTRYTMIHGRNGTTTVAGNAYLSAECTALSQSIIKDSENMYTSNTIAHELGHSVGCEHDGTNNTCKPGYLMEAKYMLENKNRWNFSSCSIDYIRNFLDKINRLHMNCLAKINDNHPKPELALASQQWVGTLYSVDEQCVIAKGLGSYLCRDAYRGNLTEFCLKMHCYNPKDDGCYYIDAGDGTPCGRGSWCISNECVNDSRAPVVFDVKCPFGDQTGIVHQQLTCKEIATQQPNDCLRQDIRQKCCRSCKHAQTTSVPVDAQCKQAIGPGSYMCRNARPYATKTYSFLCSRLYCLDTSTGNECTYIEAYEKTPCGHKMWCRDGQCVTDANAPAVPDDCPMGDQENDRSVSYNNSTCAEIRQHNNNLECYRNYTRKACCKTCADIRRSATGCEYGDHHESCFTIIASQQDSHNCYIAKNADICCETCSKYKNAAHVGCEYGDKDTGCANLISSRSESYNCYGKNAGICCGSCRQYLNASNVGCEYGDHHESCFTTIASQQDSHYCYIPKNADLCCETCSKYKNAAHIGCEYGDKDTGCANLISSRSESYNCYGKNAGICCSSCRQYLNASNVDVNVANTNLGCEYGDKSKDCATLVASRADTPNCYAGHNADICCASCGKYHNPLHKGCEYGDKLYGCSPTKCSTFTEESRRGCCNSCRSSVIVG